MGRRVEKECENASGACNHGAALRKPGDEMGENGNVGVWSSGRARSRGQSEERARTSSR